MYSGGKIVNDSESMVGWMCGWLEVKGKSYSMDCLHQSTINNDIFIGVNASFWRNSIKKVS